MYSFFILCTYLFLSFIIGTYSLNIIFIIIIIVVVVTVFDYVYVKPLLEWLSTQYELVPLQTVV